MCECTFKRVDKCAALTSMECEKCSFRKTKAELDAGRAYAKKLLNRLSPEQRDAIDRKYYGKKESFNGN